MKGHFMKKWQLISNLGKLLENDSCLYWSFLKNSFCLQYLSLVLICAGPVHIAN